MKKEESLSHEESIQLIRSMIERTKYQLSADKFLFLMWGYLVLFCALGHYFLGFHLAWTTPYYIWILMVLGGVGHWVFMAKKKKISGSVSPVDKALGGIWMGMTISIVAVVIGGFHIGWMAVYPFFMILYGMASFATGKTLSLSLLIIGGVLSIICGILAFFTTFEYQLLLLALAVVLSFLIPAHFTNTKSN